MKVEKAVKIKITGWTATFTNIFFKTGKILAYEMPPLSSLIGLLSAAKGKTIKDVDFKIGYEFTYRAKAWDVETYYKATKRKDTKGESSVWFKNFLYDVELNLYLTDLSFTDYFKKPRYTILLGQSHDLATVEEIKEVDLIKTGKGTISNTAVSVSAKGVSGVPIIMPVKIDLDTREILNQKPFIIIKRPVSIENDNIYMVKGENKDVYLYSPEFINAC
ncbi:type I-B CRISPR-associated protein Cas5 [Thermoanaerobacterium sp. PSU-2]|uniref:type I-B CRISPR-associated protein Cas5b n=1 Tax=Thermoanaerobacterium sp. PSU-2 TaxID=1930849 RepID=UPI000A14EAFE|nr:type I-B CRISPR-associated protein Cas5b [Thermoanaerobacterium sp. PSU-2]ORX23345.1 type I-B CRISPR-associated protein Cas5 [Thermoanaerobacterium sp. PSU-2]